MTTIEVATAQPYQVHVHGGALERLPELVGDATRTAILHPAVLRERAQQLAARVPRPLLVALPDAEQAKTAEVLVQCWDHLAAAGFTRNDLVVGLGGGATTDLAGFVAATWLRGMAFVSAPSTVLGMVDAAVGGKTGINIPAGKNLVGAFHEPRAVLCDLDLLATLPEADTRAGMAEVVKCGFIRDPHILDLLDDPVDALDVTSARFAELVARAIRVKAEVVAGDLRECTSHGDRVGREMLNYGHTLGHAIEKLAAFSWRHGEAISVGMVFAAELSRRTLGLDEDVVAQHRELLTRLQLPTSHHVAPWGDLRAAMALDKKSRGDQLRFVGLCEPGHVAMVEGPEESLLQDCHRAVSA